MESTTNQTKDPAAPHLQSDGRLPISSDLTWRRVKIESPFRLALSDPSSDVGKVQLEKEIFLR